MLKKLFKILFFTLVLTLTSFLFLGKITGVELPFGASILNKPCGEPMGYSIGQVDPKFGMSQSEFLGMIQQSEQVWEASAKKDLFKYDPSSEFKINLIYDERQQETVEAEKLEDKLENIETSYEKMSDEYKSLYATYQKKIKAYNSDLEDYNQRLKEYSADVAYWNKRGGAPKDEYEKLEDEKDELGDMADELSKEKSSISTLVKKINSVAKKSNNLASNYNQNLETYNSKFGGAREFEKGIFNGREINIYQFKESADLRLVLVHELGHALNSLLISATIFPT